MVKLNESQGVKIMDIKELIKNMTLEEKIGQLNQVAYIPANIDGIEDKIREGKLGSIILSQTAFAGNDSPCSIDYEKANRLQKIAVEETNSHIPILFGRDVIHGHKTVFPIPLAMAASFDMELIKESYECIAKEAYNDGIKWTFAPMLDMSRDPRWGRIIESAGEDPYLAEHVAKAVIGGFQGEDYSEDGKLCACAKHYVGYGASEGGRDYNRTEISEYSLRNFHLKAFKSAVEAGVGTVMSAFNEISGQPVTSSRHLLTEVLKEEFGFEGFVVSDWEAVKQLIDQGVAENEKMCAEMSLNAGLDMDMVDDIYNKYACELVREGKVSEAVIDEAVYRVLYIKEKAGLFENPYTNPVEVDKSFNAKMSKKMAEDSMVLLKNEGKILPLTTSQKIYLDGEMKDDVRAILGSWTLDGIAEETVTISQGIEKYITPVLDANDADVVILAIGESHAVTGEAHSLADIDLKAEHIELAKKYRAMGKKVVGVFNFGRPVAMENGEGYFDAILYAWHSGTQTGNAVADILFGKVNPSGHLPATLPRKTGQVPLYYNFTKGSRAVNEYYDHAEDRFINNYDDCKGSPLYPFGYGLSYTEFEYSNPRIVSSNGCEFVVGITVKNTGEVDGKELVQCYVCDEVASSMRPIRELKGFEKVFLKKGEEKEILFKLGEKELGFYNMQNEFVVEEGTFTAYLGANAYCDNKLSIKYTK